MKKRLISILLLGCMAASLLPSQAFADDIPQQTETVEETTPQATPPEIYASGDCGAQGDNLTWTVDTNMLLTITGSGDMMDWTEDNSWEAWGGYYGSIEAIKFIGEVTSIGNCAFEYMSEIKTVELVDSIKSIGYYAFMSCCQLDLELPVGIVSIGEGAFSCCEELSLAKLPDALTEIKDETFSGCSSLALTELPAAITKIGINAFSDCEELNISKLPDTLEAIGLFAFTGCEKLTEFVIAEENGFFSVYDGILFNKGLTEVITVPTGKEKFLPLPETVETIASWAYYGSKIKTFYLPENLNKIGSSAFSSCAFFTEFTVSSLNPSFAAHDGILYNKDMSEAILCPTGKTDSFTWPSNTTKIGDSAFAYCSRLQVTSLPEKIEVVGNFAFIGVQGLYFTIPPTIKEFGELALGYAAMEYYPWHKEANAQKTKYWTEVTLGDINKDKVQDVLDLQKTYQLSLLGGKLEDFPTAEMFYRADTNHDYIVDAQDVETIQTSVLSDNKSKPTAKSSIASQNPVELEYTVNGVPNAPVINENDEVIVEVYADIPVDSSGVQIRVSYNQRDFSLAENPQIEDGWSFKQIGNIINVVRYGEPLTSAGRTKLTTLKFTAKTSIANAPQLDAYNYKAVDYAGEYLSNSGASSPFSTYTVNRYQQNVNDDEYTLIDTEKLVSVAGKTVKIQQKDYDGFEHNEAAAGSVLSGTVDPSGTLVLSSFYDRKLYTTTFESNGGTSVPPQENKRFGSRVTKPQSPTMDDHFFVAWYSDAALTEKYEFTTPISSDIKLYAKWTDIRISGACGEQGSNITWELNSAGTLTISGEGRMKDMPYPYNCPWVDYKQYIISIVINGTVETVGDNAFSYCDNLETIQLPLSVLSIGISAFQSCKNLKLEELPPEIITIGSSAFANCPKINLRSLPQKISEIKASTFENCYGMELETLPPDIVSIGNSAFINCKKLKLKELPPDILTIGSNAFEYCEKIELRSLPQGITKIGYRTFFRCTNLSLELLPTEMASIDRDAFAYCENIRMTVLPEGLTSIGTSAFKECKKLALSELPNGIKRIGQETFDGCSALSLKTLPSELETIGESSFRNCSNMELASIPGGVTEIDRYAFEGCTKIAIKSLPEKITRIEEYSFSSSGAALTSLSDGITHIGWGAFSDCPNLALSELPPNLKTVETAAFNGCTSLALKQLPENWEFVMRGPVIFNGCTSLALTELPENLTYLDDFAGCTSLALTTLPAGIEYIDAYTFQNCSALALEALPESVWGIGTSAFEGCTKLAITKLPDKIAVVADRAFSGCPNINVTISPIYNNIDKTAFEDCGGLIEYFPWDSRTANIAGGLPDMKPVILGDVNKDRVLDIGDLQHVIITVPNSADTVDEFPSPELFYRIDTDHNGWYDGGDSNYITTEIFKTIGNATGNPGDKSFIDFDITVNGNSDTKTINANDEISVTVSLKADKPVGGAQLAISYDTENLKLLSANNTPNAYVNLIWVQEDIIKSRTFGGHGAPINGKTNVVQLRFKAKNNISTQALVSVYNAITVDGAGKYLGKDGCGQISTYKTEVYKQNIAGEEYTLSNQETLIGVCDIEAIMDEKTYNGFIENKLEPERVTSGIIAADGSLVLKRFYNRQTFDISFHSNGGTTVNSQQGVRFEALAIEPQAPTRIGYDFVGWFTDQGHSVTYDFTTPVSADIELYAKWTARGDTAYTIEHYQQNVKDNEYSLSENENMSGTSDTTVFAVAKNYTGFTEDRENPQREPSGTIASDGSLVLKLFYSRNTFALSFDGNGSTDILSPIPIAYGRPYGALPEPIRADYQFIGWYTQKDGGDKVSDETIAIESRTVYAQWASEGMGTIDGTVVTDEDNNPVSGAKITIRAGNVDYKSVETDINGKFSIFGVAYGTYNLIAAKDGRIVTTKVELNTHATVQNIILPSGMTNSVVDVKGDTPQIVAGGMDKLFDGGEYTPADKDIVQNGGKVTMRLTIEEKGKDSEQIIGKVPGTVGIYLDMQVSKETLNVGESVPIVQPLTELTELLEIFIPLSEEMRGHSVYTVHRSHGGKIQEITNTPNIDGEFLKYEDTRLVLYVNKFSTYAVAYSDYRGGADCKVTVIQSPGGIITPGTTEINSGSSKTFTITPGTNNKIKDVKVNGISVGAVQSYTFSAINASHTITAIFSPQELPYYLQNGVETFIGFADNGGYVAPGGKEIKFKQNLKQFKDIENHWGKDEIDFVTRREVFIGTAENEFNPDSEMTRGMFVTAIGRLYERSYGKFAPKKDNRFLDIAYDWWYGEYLDFAAENNIVQGVSNNLFEPNRNITREEMAVIVFNFANMLNKNTKGSDSLPLKDFGSVSPWAIEAVDYCSSRGLIVGDENGYFNPQSPATRTEVAAILKRFISYTIDTK